MKNTGQKTYLTITKVKKTFLKSRKPGLFDIQFDVNSGYGSSGHPNQCGSMRSRIRTHKTAALDIRNEKLKIRLRRDDETMLQSKSEQKMRRKEERNFSEKYRRPPTTKTEQKCLLI
jgi:hypothetical protein